MPPTHTPDTGETIDVVERIIVSPVSGVFELIDDRDVGTDEVIAGEIIGHVAVAGAQRVPVRSPFAGRLVEVVAWHGERVLPRQRIAWLRVAA